MFNLLVGPLTSIIGDTVKGFVETKKAKSELKLTDEERDFLHNKDGLSRLEQKSLGPFANRNNVIKSKKIGKKKR